MQTLNCPSCGTAAEPDTRGGVTCPGCGAVLAEPLSICPNCGWGNQTGSATCAQCETELTCVCPVCRRVNWSGADRCCQCGGELDPLAHAFRTVGASFELQRRELVQKASLLREAAERESQARLELLREADRRRMRRAAEQAQIARRREKRIILAAGIAGAVFLLILIVGVIVYF
jgi:hypothetical protein